MARTMFHLALWSATITEYSRELGYVQRHNALTKDRASIYIDSRENKLLIATLELESNSLDYEITRTQDCIDFCQLLNAIESVKG